METLELRETISKEWRTDDYIRKQLLCNKLKYSNQFNQRFILDYNINDYDGTAEEKYIKDDKENIIYLKTYLNKNKELVDLLQAQCKLKNARLLSDEEYHLDLLVLDDNQTKKITKNMTTKELFPLNELKCLTTKNKENGKTTVSTKAIRRLENG